MPKIKMCYGIDLGTTNSAIVKMENGEAVIIKSDTLKDTLPSCVSFTRKKITRVGDGAYNDLRQDKARATKSWSTNKQNVFIEFKRTMGLDKEFYSSNMEESFNSEQLSAEVLKTLKSFVSDGEVDAAVITIPAKFKVDQISATKRAATMAGIKNSELLQEPIAAAIAYGLTAENKNETLLVFDFGGGTFDVALLTVEDGIMKVKDTEGDNYLGGKNLDYAIVDKILIPFLKENYCIKSILAEDEKRNILRDAVKFYAEQAKNQLSFNEKADITSQLDEFGNDDEGEPLELDLIITQEDLKKVLTPIFQKAIDITKSLLERNHLSGSDISNLILVGGPTYSPILRSMLKEQITDHVNVSIDPMTAVATGAAIYASGREYESSIGLKAGTIALDISYPSSSTSKTEFISVKLLPEECKGNKPDHVFVEVSRTGWSSGKTMINSAGDVIECDLREGKPNSFKLNCYDDTGSRLQCFPDEFTILQGMVVSSATLPYHIGIEALSGENEKDVFVPIPGLEKNKSIPAIGQKNDFFKLSHPMRPNVESDKLIIPIYQGEYGAEGSSAIYNDHVDDIVITGNDVPTFVPENTFVNIQIKVDASQLMHVDVEFVAIHESIEKDIDIKARKGVTEDALNQTIEQAYSLLSNIKNLGSASTSEISECENLLNDIKKHYEGEKSSEDGKMHLLADSRKACLYMETINKKYERDNIEKQINNSFTKLESANNELGNHYDTEVQVLREQIERIHKQNDLIASKEILEQIQKTFMSVTLIYQLIGFIKYANDNFDSIEWTNPSKARELVNQGMKVISCNPKEEELAPIINSMRECLNLSETDKLKF